ncbi:EthD family reductase [Ulvibacter litoralis]|uniref:EthD domain-containing protein n=1 Tax=Ulvibacter litoralis TaxID=227084 RepID=A0A1G7GMM5_9FLAO|nr:EthD family reductase [Ulvibacter litoralis]GHC55657.1 ethyl tert-butyl ether degradation protein EthD [Ulvibacter litoralis]SDE89356.1 conserved hypothetical protein [Ulvibacter litoralis]
MIKLTVLYPNNADVKFDKEYYTKQHSQLLSELLGDAIVASDVNFGLTGATPYIAAPYVVIANLTFASLDSFEKSFGANAAAILADLPNFTNAQPLVQISEVV